MIRYKTLFVLALSILLGANAAHADMAALDAALVAAEQTTDFEVAPVFAQLSSVGRHTDATQATAWQAQQKLEAARQALREEFATLSPTEQQAFLDRISARSRNEVLMYDFEPFSSLLPRIAEIRREQNESLSFPNGRAAGSVLKPRPMPTLDLPLNAARDGEVNGSNFPANHFAMTFDDGPSPRTTQVILDALQDFNSFGNFFQLGQLVAGQETYVQAMHNAGHTVGNHSWNHPQMTNLDVGSARTQVQNTNAALERAVPGLRPFMFRFPYGARNQALRQTVNQEGLTSVMWNIDTLDWKYRDPDTIINLTVTQINQQGRGIILMHDIHAQTTLAVPHVLQALADRGATMIRFVDGN